ncbi:MAG: serine hydrolase [Acidobacteriota bacterium]
MRLKTSTSCVFLILASGAWWLSSPAHANNGAIAIAYPIDGVLIDGKLDDWGDGHTAWPIAEVAAEDAPEAADFSAVFRVAYSLPERALYVMVEVTDDFDVQHAADEPEWDQQDSHLLYVDAQHVPRGSGGVLYMAGKGLRELISPPAAWDPANARASWDDAKVAIARHGQKTVYEWRVELGEDLEPGRSIGLDHLVNDRDPEDEDNTAVLWGEGFGKSTRTWRLGDVLLLERDTALGRLEGSVAWQQEGEEARLDHVRITRIEQPQLWVQAEVDDEGRYAVELPGGEYRVSSPYRLTHPFGGDEPPRRIDDAAGVSVTLSAEGVAQAEPLVLRTFERPDYLFGEQGAFAGFDASRIPEIDAFVEAFRRYYEVPGISVALVHGGKVVYHRTLGVKNQLTRQPVAADTMFEAASITKPTFGFAVMRLAERGAIDLDAPLHQSLAFPNIEGDERYRKMTARHVLSHRSGLPNWAWGGPGGWRRGDELELRFEPGSAYGYSGEGFNYLGRVVEEITGKTLEQVLREEALEPMGLTNTFFALDEKQEETASIGHWHTFPSWKRRATEISVASSMHTEARDYANFAIGLIQGAGLKPESYAEMFRPHTTLTKEERDTEEEQHVGLGFFLRDTPFGPLVEHGGNNGDFRCKFGAVPEAGLAYAIFTNNNVGGYLADAVEQYLLFGRREAQAE